MNVPGIRLQRLVEDLGTTLLEVIEAAGPLEAEVTGATIFDANDDLLISPGELLLGVGVATQAETADLIRAAGQAARRGPGREGAGAGQRRAARGRARATASRCSA